jgi:hypothetical protein
MGLKQCSKCGDFKEQLDNFYLDKKTSRFRADCKDCCQKAAKEWRKKNPEKVKTRCKTYYENNKERLLELNKQWKKENPEKAKANFRNYRRRNSKRLNIKAREDYKNNPEMAKKSKGRGLKSRHSITLEQFDQMRFDQDWCCKNCGVNESDLLEITGKGLAVDHNHKTGKIRGLLCILCNTLMGASRDNLYFLQNAINYLKEQP